MAVTSGLDGRFVIPVSLDLWDPPGLPHYTGGGFWVKKINNNGTGEETGSIEYYCRKYIGVLRNSCMRLV